MMSTTTRSTNRTEQNRTEQTPLTKIYTVLENSILLYYSTTLHRIKNKKFKGPLVEKKT